MPKPIRPDQLKSWLPGMSSFGCGDKCFPAETVEQGILIADLLEKHQRERESELALKKAEHGHNFSWKRECPCGLSEFDYLMLRNPQVCPVATF